MEALAVGGPNAVRGGRSTGGRGRRADADVAASAA